MTLSVAFKMSLILEKSFEAVCELTDGNAKKYLLTQDWLRANRNYSSYINFIRVQSYEWFSLSKVKKIAEEFLAKYPTLFSADFDANKKALDQLAIIPNRALRNQIAGAITKRVASEISEKSEPKSVMEEGELESSPASEAPSSEVVSQEA